jgi:N-ethylmaleimide reductase
MVGRPSLTRCIDKGGRIFLQLWHVGRISHSSHHPDGALPVSASAVRPAGEALAAGFKRLPYETPRALETDEIPRIVDEYDQAAARDACRF